MVHSVLARELSEEDVHAVQQSKAPGSQSAHVEMENVATLLLSSVKPAADARCAFEVRSAHGSPLRLQARGDVDAATWIAAISKSIEAQLVSGRGRGQTLIKDGAPKATSSPGTPRRRGSKSLVPPPPPLDVADAPRGAMLRSFSQPDFAESPAGSPRSRASAKAEAARADVVRDVERRSPACADCGAPNPEWCAINFGCLVCLRCSGVHRSLGTHVSKVRSLRLDRLPEGVLRFLDAVGNDTANAVFERTAPPGAPAKPTPKSDAKTLQAFARAKWQHRAFAEKRPETDAPNDLRRAAERGDVRDALAALAAYDAEPRALVALTFADGDTPLHVAAAHGNFLVAQCFMLNASDANDLVSAADARGRSPHDRLKTRPLNLDADEAVAEATAILDGLLTPGKPAAV